ncbi:MAG: Crp/Fnr family transcriptional regulator [Gammaproteobacteria bacterium]
MNARAIVTADGLNAVDLFRGLPHGEREAIAARLSARRYAAGDVIVTQEDARTDVFFIVSGTVRVSFHAASGKDVQFRDMHAGETFGELSAIDGQPRSAEVLAVTEVFAAIATGEVFRELATGFPTIAGRLLGQLTSRIRALSDRVVEFSTLGVSNRIHGELLRLAHEHGVRHNRAEIAPAPTHADIAARVSTHREAVTRELAALAKRGLVKRGRARLEVLDVERLEALVANVTAA